MQRFLVFLVMMSAVFLIPAVSMADNQKVAQYIADRLGEKYPANSIHVKYNGGEVTLAGEMNSPQQMNEALQYVSSLTGVVKVVNNMKISQAVNQPLQVSSAVIAPEKAILPSETMPVTAPLPTVNPLPRQEPVISPVSGILESGRPTLAPYAQNGDTPAPLNTYAMEQAYPQQTYANQGQPMHYNQPMPMGVQNATTARYDQPNLPNYAWPSYAANPNYAQVAYPRNYCPESAPYIGPFYPYPQVPLGWRKVTMEWHDGWWWLDFDDGTAKGPFSPLFRQPNPQRY